MGMPYALIKVLKNEEPYLDREGRQPKQQAEFLLRDNHMQGKYLGACLNSCRWGGLTSVRYDMSIKDMVFFIQSWMQQNKENFYNLWHELQIEDLYKNFELPFIDHKSCPRNENHKGVIRDLGGRLRCAHKSERRFKPSFVYSWKIFDNLSQMEETCFCERDPELNEDRIQRKKFNEEEQTFNVIDVCYAIISDKGRILPLETILKRLNLLPETITVYCREFGHCNRLGELDKKTRKIHNELCPGHVQLNNMIEFLGDGWDLAFYAQKWYEQLQATQAPFFEK